MRGRRDAVEARQRVVDAAEPQLAVEERHADRRAREERAEHGLRGARLGLRASDRRDVLECDQDERLAAVGGRDRVAGHEDRPHAVRQVPVDLARLHLLAPRRAHRGIAVAGDLRPVGRGHPERLVVALGAIRAGEASAGERVGGAVGEQDPRASGLDEHRGEGQEIERLLEHVAGDPDARTSKDRGADVRLARRPSHCGSPYPRVVPYGFAGDGIGAAARV